MHISSLNAMVMTALISAALFVSEALEDVESLNTSALCSSQPARDPKRSETGLILTVPQGPPGSGAFDSALRL